MLDTNSLPELQREIYERIASDASLLDKLREDVRPLRNNVHKIHPRITTAVSLVGTDGGNNQLRFDPFMVQLIRVVDSSANQYCLEVISSHSDIASLNARHIANGQPMTPLGRMMARLGIDRLDALTPMIPAPPDKPKPSWVSVYRELTEWAVLLDLLHDVPFGTDTVLVCDGLLRSKVFKGDLFRRYRRLLDEGIAKQFQRNRRRLYIVGVAKHNKVLDTYRLAMALEGVMRTSYASYVAIPRSIEQEVYVWPEYARDDEAGGEVNKFVGGTMFFVKFGDRAHDPIWAVDVLTSQREQVHSVLGYLLADAVNGFPIPMFPVPASSAHMITLRSLTSTWT